MNPFLLHSPETDQSRYQERFVQTELLRETRAVSSTGMRRGEPIRMPAEVATRLLRLPVRAVGRLGTVGF
jgi:hypothetical protein